mgnify:CR=1 FL=1
MNKGGLNKNRNQNQQNLKGIKNNQNEYEQMNIEERLRNTKFNFVN